MVRSRGRVARRMERTGHSTRVCVRRTPRGIPSPRCRDRLRRGLGGRGGRMRRDMSRRLHFTHPTPRLQGPRPVQRPGQGWKPASPGSRQASSTWFPP